jgi:hypothetical protein
MDQDELVEFQIEGGRKVIDQLARDGLEVHAAAWIKTVEDGSWMLYVATPLVEASGLKEAYRFLHGSLQRVRGNPISLSDISMVGPADPIAKAVSNILDRHPGRIASHYTGKQLGDSMIEGAYVYPVPDHAGQEAGRMTDREIMEKVLDLMDRSGGFENSTITLTDGTAFRGVPIGLELLNNAITIKFVVDHLRSPENHPVSEIAEIR